MDDRRQSSAIDAGASFMKGIVVNGHKRHFIKALRELSYAQVREVARQIAMTPAYVRSRRQRKKGEVFFAHFKRILKLRRL